MVVETDIKDVLIIYVDDDESINKSSVRILEFGHSHIKFQDKQLNYVIIPFHRVLKVKWRGDADV